MQTQHGDEGRPYPGRTYIYGPPPQQQVSATPCSAVIPDLEAHIAAHIGEVTDVFHEMVSDLVHIDVHIVRATEQRPWSALVTSGMSDRPMNIPPDMRGMSPYAELYLALPPDWPVGTGASTDERHYWPVYWLKSLARIPHVYRSWLGAWHTVPNGDPAQPLAPGVPFTGVMLASPQLPPEEFGTLRPVDGREISILAMMPLHQDEMDLKVRRGAEALMPLLEQRGVTELVDPARPSVLGGDPPRRGLFGRRR